MHRGRYVKIYIATQTGSSHTSAIGLAKCNNRSLPESAESLGLQAGEYVDAPVATTHRLTFPAFRRRFVRDLLHQPSIGLDDFCFADLDAFEI